MSIIMAGLRDVLILVVMEEGRRLMFDKYYDNRFGS